MYQNYCKYAEFKIIKNHPFSFYVENMKRKPVVKEKFIYLQTNLQLFYI